ncbi:MAG: tail fiber assembly protein [Pseudodesulfovibrio sp.]|uniref:tail fiber assembly protein n=1 Tax=Pseudodesulfovibrio sp. TaxID=2035812 RepID=UPI003D0CC820
MLRLIAMPDGGIQNLTDDVYAAQLLAKGGVEIDREVALEVFGDDWSCVAPSCAWMAEDGTITYTPPDRSSRGLLWDAASKMWIVDQSSPVLAAAVRDERDRLLAACDWTQMPDSPLDDDTQAAWTAYRQALREVPEQPGFPVSVEWPAEPA